MDATVPDLLLPTSDRAVHDPSPVDERLQRWAREHAIPSPALDELRIIVREASLRGEDASSSWLPSRYEDRGPISRGGSAEVRRVWDRILGRTVAMKILRWEHVDSSDRRARFLNEARVTSQLDHPFIVPIHDQGVLADGRPWFTMKEIRGRTLDVVVSEEPVAEHGRRRRLIDGLTRVCEAVGYAHSRGVVHRDLKPANLMLGPFGEVWVLDWGVARDPRAATDAPEPEAAPPWIDHERTATRTGQIFGTVAYMSPEQARGATADVTSASDVWSLGLILFEILTGRRAMEGSVEHVWIAASQARVPSFPADVTAPADLVAVYEKAVREWPDDRFPDALSMREALKSWLDGDAQRVRARAIVTAARDLDASLDRLDRSAREAQAEAKRLRSAIRDFDPAEAKAPMWTLEDRAQQLEQEHASLEAEQIERLRAALQHDPDCAEAHEALADIYRGKIEDAELAAAPAEVARYEHLLRRHDRGSHRRFLEGLGALTLHTAPPAAVTVRRYLSEARQLVLAEPIELGPTPVDARELRAGSYVLELRAPGAALVRYPVRVRRDEHVEIRAPGDASPLAVPLPPAHALGPDDVYVPPGLTTVGGDPLAAEPVPRRAVWIDGFVIQRHPVTVAEYLTFLNDLARAGRPEEAELAAPRLARGTVDAHVDALGVVRNDDGTFDLAPDEHGKSVHPRWPICNVDWYGALAYARWYAARTGEPWRLPNELEWEKAARGADERAYPWGNQPEPTWACILGATEHAPCRAEVDAYPTDESPYGVRGMAGNVRDWCANVWRPEGPPVRDGRLELDLADPADDTTPRSIRGGAWQTVPAFARAAGRFASAPRDRFAVLGFRLARSFPS